MTDFIFATHNENKVKEAASVLGGEFRICSLRSIGMNDEIPEPFDTLRENAEEKARFVFKKTGKDCFSEDTGLLVDALNGEPGVKSARYAGDHDFQANIDKLLKNLEGIENRNARFVTIICLIYKGKEYIFEGECRGAIGYERIGTLGFGYDSIFIPEGSHKTFGEMDLEEKNTYSHRKKAVEKLVAFLLRQ
jgi:XTP/dITP diphosphohydrolase